MTTEKEFYIVVEKQKLRNEDFYYCNTHGYISDNLENAKFQLNKLLSERISKYLTGEYEISGESYEDRRKREKLSMEELLIKFKDTFKIVKIVEI